MTTKVYLIGSGPGDPELMTLQAIKVLKSVDVILYDRLVGRKIVKSLPKRALKIYVGEKHGDAAQRQQKIYTLIKKYSMEGLKIARLQNGDPLLFGRGGEEIQFLRHEGIHYEVIPGITSAIGVPSSVGLPLTQRGISSAVLVIPGHSMEGHILDWGEVASFKGTIIILMGASRIGKICSELISHGKDPSTPACMIMKGSMSGQRMISCKLEELGNLAHRKRISAPAVAVIGESVKLADFYNG